MPATSAVARCVASSPLKNRSPGLLADLSLQLGRLSVIPPPLPEARKGVAWPLAELPAPAMQYIRLHLKCPCHLGNRSPRLQSLDRSHFHVTRKRSSKQSHDTILHLMKIVS